MLSAARRYGFNRNLRRYIRAGDGLPGNAGGTAVPFELADAKRYRKRSIEGATDFGNDNRSSLTQETMDYSRSECDA